MSAIFYDLETSDTLFIGQILNYCFIQVDRNFEVVSELTGTIRCSRLQLPRAGAILANRINILKHQQEAQSSEPQAMRQIFEYLQGVIDQVGARIPLVGFNSARFDLPFLRTSLMRNGLSPYFFGKINPKDLLFVARKLAATHPDFPRIPALDAEGLNTGRMSLRLESLTKHFGLLKGKQTHYSRDDVLLTIDLAKYLYKNFNLDVRTYEAYEVTKLHSTKNPVIFALEPNYDLHSSERALRRPLALHESSSSSALWVDLTEFQKAHENLNSSNAQDVLEWYGLNSHQLILESIPDPQSPAGEKLSQLAVMANKKFKDVTLQNFFNSSTCDIEFDIYRLHKNFDFKPLDALGQAIWKGDESALNKLTSRDARVLFIRFQLAQYMFGTPQDQQVEKLLKQYFLFRYAGNLSTVKNKEEYLQRFPESALPVHPALKDLYLEIEQAMQTDCSAEDIELLRALKEFYDHSDARRLSGRELGLEEQDLQLSAC